MSGRSASRNPVSLEKKPPLWWHTPDWDDVQKLPARNIKWQARLGSHTKGDPIVANGLVWVGTNNSHPRDPQVKAPLPVLMCFREKDGKFLYQYVTQLGPDERLQDSRYAGHTSTCMVVGERMWFTTPAGETVCLDIGPLQRGQGMPSEVWKVDMRRQLGVVPSLVPMGYGKTCSIGAPYKDYIHVLTGNGVDDEDKALAPKAPSLVCFHKDTGMVVWSDNSPGNNINEGQYASPLVIEINGKGQVIAGMGDGWVRSFDAETGKLLWQFDTQAKDQTKNQKKVEGRPFRHNVYAAPVFHDNRVYIGQGSSLVYPVAAPAWLYCLDPTKSGDISPEIGEGGSVKPNSNSGMIWRFGGVDAKNRRRFHGTHGSVAIQDGLVLATNTHGYVHCLDAKSGREHWTHDVKAEITSAPLIVDGKVYVGTEDAVWAYHLGTALKVLAEVEMPSSIYCSPIFANGTLYVATRDSLYAIADDGKGSIQVGSGFWPQWRGPDRTNIARETGLLKSWPPEGAPLEWKAVGIGTGPMSLSVAGGRIFTQGYRDEREYLHSLEAASGRILWSSLVGPGIKSAPGMDWLSQRTPTIDGDRVYAFGVKGDLVCFEAKTGKEVWRKNYPKDFDGKSGPWGFCDFPLVDGDKLICTPGGAQATMVALNKHSGEVVWKCALPQTDRGTYGGIVLTEIGGSRLYIQQLEHGVVGVAASDGKLLWRYAKNKASQGNVHTAIPHKDLVFCSNGWGNGCGLLKLHAPPDDSKFDELYYAKMNLDPWLGSSVLLGDHVHTSCGKCIEFKTGKVLHDLKLTRTTMTCADGMLIHRTGANQIQLHEMTPQGYVEKGQFESPKLSRSPAWSFPVVAGGKLYLRDQDVLLCHDLRDKSARSIRQPDAIFVPTPQDIVEKMLELAGVKRSDLVYDLGCGDGRIVVTAAKKYGCRAVGFDLDPECIKLSRASVAEAKVGDYVAIQQRDIFTLDLSKADVIALYLLPKLNVKLIPQLQKLKPGARIVSHLFPMEGIRPERVVRHVSAEDGVEHTLYLWVTPLKKD